MTRNNVLTFPAPRTKRRVESPFEHNELVGYKPTECAREEIVRIRSITFMDPAIYEIEKADGSFQDNVPPHHLSEANPDDVAVVVDAGAFNYPLIKRVEIEK